jgi:phospholipid/cholesterol/gamma-HCH transport system substrate-binding protein
MKKNLSDYLVALAVIACSLVLLGALTYALSGRKASKSDRILEIDYPDVTGIKLHSDVRYAGAPAGTVTNIRLLTFAEREAGTTAEQKRNAVRITLTLHKDLPPLPDDVRASLSSETLLSEKFIALTAGSPTAPKLANGAILQGRSGGGLDGLFEAIGPVAESLPSLVKTAEDLLKGLQPLLGKTSDAVDGVKLDLLPKVSKLAESLQATSTTADLALKRIDKTVEGLDGPIKTDLEELKGALVKMQLTMTSANQLLGRTDKNLDARMQELSVVLQNLKVASTYAKTLTQTLGESPNRLIFGGKPKKLTSEDEILRATKPVPGAKP